LEFNVPFQHKYGYIRDEPWLEWPPFLTHGVYICIHIHIYGVLKTSHLWLAISCYQFMCAKITASQRWNYFGTQRVCIDTHIYIYCILQLTETVQKLKEITADQYS